MNDSKSRFGFLGAVVMLGMVWVAGCGSPESVSEHTHLWIGEKNTNVWSYERGVVIDSNSSDDPKPNVFLKKQMVAGEKVMLESGQIVSYDGSSIRVGKKKIKSTNVHVERDGTIRENAFIRERE